MPKSIETPERGSEASTQEELGTAAPAILGDKKDFLAGPGAKFLSNRTQNVPRQPEPKPEGEAKPVEVEAPEAKPIVSKKPVGYVKQTEAKAQEFEQKYKEADSKLQELSPKLTAAEQKAADLEAKLATAKSEEEYRATETKLQNAERERDQIKQDLDQKTQALRFLNIQADPEFQQEFIIPVQSQREAIEKFGEGLDEVGPMIQRAIAAHRAVYEARTPEERTRHENIRDGMFNQVYQELPEIKKLRFQAAVDKYFEKSEDLHNALQNHEQVTQQYQERRQQYAQESKTKTLTAWNSAFDETSKDVEQFATLSDDEITQAKELKLEYDISQDDKLARAIIDPEINVTEKDATRILNQGRVFPVLKAKIAILQKQLADKDELLQRYRGASEIIDDGSGGGSRGGKPPVSEAKSSFLQKFAPGRR